MQADTLETGEIPVNETAEDRLETKSCEDTAAVKWLFWQSLNRKGIHLNVSVLSFILFFFKGEEIPSFAQAGKTALIFFFFPLFFFSQTHLAYRILPHTPATTIINYFRIRRSEIEGMSLQKGVKKKFCILIALC